MTTFDSEREDGWEGSRGRCDRRRARRRARWHADRRADLLEEFVKYVIVCALLLLLVRPVGVIVALIWGWKLFRRYRDLELTPALKKRWIERDLEGRGYGPGGAGEEEVEGSLLRRLAEDPRTEDNRAHARAALDDLAQLERDPVDGEGAGAGPREVRLAELIEGALEALRPRLERTGVEVRSELDSEGALLGDPALLQRVVTHIVDSGIEAAASAAEGERRLHVLVGENLAGSEVWMRVRHEGAPLERERIAEIVRPFYAPGEEGSPSEFSIRLSRGPVPSVRDDAFYEEERA